MTELNVWNVDQVAASALVASLSIDLDDERMEKLAIHFARHREVSCSWVIEQVLAKLVSKLETEAQQVFQRKSEEWVAGYAFAEQIVATMPPDDLLDIGFRPSPTKGQILRRLVRDARKRAQQ